MVVVGLVAGLLFAYSIEHPTTYVAPVAEVEEVTTQEVDVIDAAKAELERINQELDAEEQRLLEERSQIESRLEQIRSTRSSFQ